MSDLYGLMAEFDSAQALVDAAHETRRAGYRRFDTFSPFPIDDVKEALSIRHSRISLFVLAGGILGGVIGYGFQYYAAVINYPLNVGGRPIHAVPAFLPITFELAILGAAVAGVLGMFWLNRLPMPYHPVFNVPQFRQASRKSFFLCIETADPLFDRETTRQFLERLRPLSVREVDA